MAAGVAVDAREAFVRVAAGDEALDDLLLDCTSAPASPNARSSAIASSNAARVPDPIEKCIVRSASPMRIALPADQWALDSSGIVRG